MLSVEASVYSVRLVRVILHLTWRVFLLTDYIIGDN